MSRRYKSATPALNEKLQHYRDDPEARAELHRRIRQAQAEKRRTPSPNASPRAHAATQQAGLLPGAAPEAYAAQTSLRSSHQRNFICENATVICPWPCTGALSATAIAAAQQQQASWLDDEPDGCSPRLHNITSSISNSRYVRPSTAPAAVKVQAASAVSTAEASTSDKQRLDLTLDLEGLQRSKLQQEQQQQHEPDSPPTRTMSPSRHRPSSAPRSRCRSACSHRGSPMLAMQAVEGAAAPASCLERLASQMAAKKEVAAARAAEAAERRIAIAAAEQQRREAKASKKHIEDAERLACQQAEQQRIVLAQRQQVWSSMVAAAALTSMLNAELQQMKKRGMAAIVIAATYKRHLRIKRTKQLMELVLRMRRLLAPFIERQRQAARARCAVRLLNFLQLSSSNSIILLAAQRLRRNVVYIQRFWRRVRLVRLAQETLLIREMKQLEQQIVQRNRTSAAAAPHASGSNSGGRPASASTVARSGSHSGSVSANRSRHRQLELTDSHTRSNSRHDRSANGAAAALLVPHKGVPLVRPKEFFLDDDEADPESPAGQTSSTKYDRSNYGCSVVSSEAAASPYGPMPPRGVLITGELTRRRPASPSGLVTQTTAGVSNTHSPKTNSGRQQNSAAIDHGMSTAYGQQNSTSPKMHESPSVSVREGSGTSNGMPSAADRATVVGFHQDGVIDLELEARLKDLFDPLPSDVRRAVVRSHLASVRRQLAAAQEEHAAAMKHYHEKMKLEQLKYQLLKQSGVDVPITLQPPRPPHMHVLVPKSKLKALIVQGMDLLLQQLLEARLACDDAKGAAAVAACRMSGAGGKSNS